MIPLLANTATLLFEAAGYMTVVVTSDSSTITRVTKHKDSLLDSRACQGLTCYMPILIKVKPKDQVWAQSTGTPNICVFTPLSEIMAGIQVRDL